VKLRGTIALVTGASRGAGRGIAHELGAAGATVYVTGRTTRAQQPAEYRDFARVAGFERMPGSIEETAEAVDAAGGRGIAVRCDHSQEDEVRALVARIEREHGRLDLLVNNAWGGHESFTPASLDAPFWEQPLAHWRSMFEHGLRNHVLMSHAAAPLFVRQRGGLLITTTYWDRGRYLKGNLFYDLAKAAMNRLAFGLAEELRPHGVSSLALAPGWMRTEIILQAFRTSEERWREVPALARTESPRYLGRAVVALAADPAVAHKSGRVLLVGELAREYGFTDVDGRLIPPFELE
jgi:NAD(P)-dependent dehydrogenase (short-subunit alcohol dehydrogenase family)